ncbi:GRP family sugar transporter [Bifidobacterium panos]|uniref:Glucose transporter n=1 Tax=Bifidobacterium panos TaxID=2675321 RepID=A0ABX1T0U8_9BIFI|nr:GRP family sugar transporter [Bifidobacterium sp. DSM 109963]NMN02647.1 glucose transporter [Bifidobacterium sp. DSM 109963]
MGILIGILPAIFWGILPLWLQKVGKGTFRSQLLGTTIGIVFVAAAIHVICGYQLSTVNWVLFALSGFCWSFGQAGQYYCYTHLGVSVTMPLSTALQIIGNSIIGGLFFGEWEGQRDIVISLVALVIIVVGVYLTNGKGTASPNAKPRDYVILVLSTAGYWLYSAFPLMASVDNKLQGFLPQSLGMLMSAFLIGFFSYREIVDGATVRNISSGLIFAVAASTYLIAMSMIGMVNAFVLSQLNVLVSTLSGAIVLKEAAGKGKIAYLAVGLVVLIAGAALMVTA